MARTITLKYSGYCRECSVPLPVGALAKWMGPGALYGLTCHPYNVAAVQRGLEEAQRDVYVETPPWRLG